MHVFETTQLAKYGNGIPGPKTPKDNSKCAALCCYSYFINRNYSVLVYFDAAGLRFMITFHGGMRALTYEWGSRTKNKSSTIVGG